MTVVVRFPPWLAFVVVAACANTEERSPGQIAESTRVHAKASPSLHPAPAPDTAAMRIDPWAEARRRGVDFRALGQEPGWYLEIDDGVRIHLVADYGEREAETPAPAPRVDSAGALLTYDARTEAHALSVVIHREPEERPCRDGMSGFAFAATVSVRLDTMTYRGCGRWLR